MTQSQKCHLCDNNTMFGGGFFLKGKYICIVCEEKIMNTRQTDTKYENLKESIRELLLI